MIPQEMIRRYQIFPAIFKNQHARIKRVKPVGCYRGSKHTSKMNNASAPGENIVGSNQ